MNIIDLAIVFVCFAVWIYVGWRSSKKTSTSSEFLTTNRSLNKFQAGLSMAATDFGGSGLVGAIGYCYLVGMSGLWWDLAAAPAMLFVGLYLAKKLYGLNANTIPEYLGKRYSAPSRYIAAIMQLCTVIASLSVQFTISGAVLYTITGLNHTLSLIIAMAIALILTIGGLRAVVNTDAAQFIMIIISVVLCLIFTLISAGGLGTIASKVTSEFMRIDQIGFWTPLSWFFMCTLGYSSSQQYVQRMVSSKDVSTAKFSAFFTAGFYLVISIILGLIGVASSVLIPGIKDTNTVFPQLMISYLPHGLIGMGVVGVFAATISTATSQLHAISIIFVNDLYNPLKKKAEDHQLLKVSRIVIVTTALSSLCLSVFFNNIINVLYVAGLFYTTAVFAPLIVGLNSKIKSGMAALISIIGSTTVALVWEYGLSGKGGITNLPSNLVGVVVGVLLLLVIGVISNNKDEKLA